MTKVYSQISVKEGNDRLKEKKNYNSIDLFKFIFSFFIITLHIGLFWSFNEELEFWFLNTVSKFAVPFFFASSGFLFFTKLDYKNDKIENSRQNRKKFFKYILRMLLLYGIWSFIYLLILIPKWVENGWLSFGIFKDYLISTFRLYSYYHMWYMIDLLYAIIFAYLILSLVKRKYVIFIAAGLYLIEAIFYGYFSVQLPFADLLYLLMGFSEAIFNAIFRAFPFIFMGYYFGNHQIKLKKNIILLVVSVIFLVAEVYLLRTFTENKLGFSYIIFTLPCACLSFSLIMKINVRIEKDKSKLLRNISTMIYCVHPAVVELMTLFIDRIAIHSVIQYAIVASVSLAIAFVVVKLSQIKYLKFLKYLY